MPRTSSVRQRREAAIAAASQPRLVIDRLSPCVDGGRYPAKAVVDQEVVVGATIFMDGHEQIRAELQWRRCAGGEWTTEALRLLGNDRWEAVLVPRECGMHEYRIVAWYDRWDTYRRELDKKYRAGVPVHLERQEGVTLLRHEVDDADLAESLGELAGRIESATEQEAIALLLDPGTADLMHQADPRLFLLESGVPLPIDVERLAAGFASWYELFPRSQSHSPQIHGTFEDVIGRLPAIKAMGFDVLYFPPIHPIGRSNRKGRNNSLKAAADDPGSPYAIGSEEGGHDAVHAELGGLEGFQRLCTAAAQYGLEVALDFAIQCSPDHPWLKQHPGWFSWRPDGSIRHAENPPKKYEDIVNVDFYAADAIPDLWLALRDVVQFWIEHGVSIFRVDNPHTKPLPFWQWLIADIRAGHPQAIFLSEAFTRPAMMYQLAKVGFTQSYTYFIWRNDKQEITDYLNELAHGAPKEFYRPNFFVNTPDINPKFLQTSGRPGFMIRAALAATTSGVWGVYSGFELCEYEAVAGKEEYLHSEKYEIKPRDWQAPGNIIAVISRLNHIRRDNPALQTHLGIRFHGCDNDRVLFFSKATYDHGNLLLVAISLDPQQGQGTWLELPLQQLGLPDNVPLEVEELMRGLHLAWSGPRQHWHFDPQDLPFAIWRVRTGGGER